MNQEKIPTKFAPAEKAPENIIKEQSKKVKDAPFIQEIIDAFPDVVVIMNSNRQMVFANKSFRKIFGDEGINKLYGQRTGDFFQCSHAHEMPGGCGTSEFCRVCGAAKALVKSQQGEKSTDECRIIRRDSDALNFQVDAVPITIGDEAFTIFTIKDISSEKRRRALERIFFHDIMNTAGGVYGFAELLKDAEPEEITTYSDIIFDLSVNLVDEINAQRELTSAENNELKVNPETINSGKLMNSVIELFKNHEVAKGKKIIIIENSENIDFKSDKTLLGRVIGNMVKNALEACKQGETVTLGCFIKDEDIDFSVNNPSFMPRDIQLQIFQRSFSTKGAGRGLGTYSIKLLTEKYLNGKVSFTSTPEEGTTFHSFIPK